MLHEDRLKYYMAIQHTEHGRSYPFLNCWGLICEFYKRELNIALDLYTDYDPNTMTKGYDKAKPEFNLVSSPEFGDIVAFVTSAGACYHVGVMLDSNRFLHSQRGRGSQITPLSMTAGHILFYRHKGLNNESRDLQQT